MARKFKGGHNFGKWLRPFPYNMGKKLTFDRKVTLRLNF